MRLVNGGTSGKRALKYYTYLSDQTTQLTLAGRTRVTLYPRELLFLSSAMAGEWIVERDYTCSSLVFDSDVFREHIPYPDSILGRKLLLPFHLSDVLISTMESAWSLGREGLFDRAGPKLMQSFLGMLSLLALPGSQEAQSNQSVLQIRREQIKAFIRRNYGNSTLSVARLASQFGLSPRYVSMAFEADEHSPSQYLRHVRLTESARRLQDQACVAQSITQISFDCGFNSSAHFSNEFRREFGVSPREYRREVDRTDGQP
jgi:AraC-like DNA-binding protein